MKKHPKAFDPLFTNMIAAGEAGGILDTILKRLATYIEKAVKLKCAGEVRDDLPGRGHRDRRARGRRHPLEGHPDVRGAVLRPRRRAAAADAHRHRDEQLPRAASCRSSSSASARSACGFKQYYGTDRRPARRSTRVMLKLPILGLIMRKIAVARFCRTLVDAAELGRADSRRPGHHRADVGQRRRRRRHPGDAQEHRARRNDVGAAARKRACFPPMVTQMISVGETTGALDTMLAKIADFYEEEVDTAVAGLLTLLEPIMIAFLGGVVGGIVIAMYLPIFDLISKLA